jgi:hypothetical protein
MVTLPVALVPFTANLRVAVLDPYDANAGIVA